MRLSYAMILNENNKYSYDKDKAKIVLIIFDMYISGNSLRSISRYLKDNGVLSPTGKENWSAQCINDILSNPKYIPLVSLDVFFAVQDIRS